MYRQLPLLLCVLTAIAPVRGHSQDDGKRQDDTTENQQVRESAQNVSKVYQVDRSNTKRFSQQLRLFNPKLAIQPNNNSLVVRASERELVQVDGLLPMLQRLPVSVAMTPDGKIIRDTRVFVFRQMPHEAAWSKVLRLQNEDLKIECNGVTNAMAANGSPAALGRLRASLLALSPEIELLETRGWWSRKVEKLREFKGAAAATRVELTPLKTIKTDSGQVLHIVAFGERKKLDAFESKVRTMDAEVRSMPRSYLPELFDLPSQLGDQKEADKEEASIHNRILGCYEVVSKSTSGDKNFEIQLGKIISKTFMPNGKTAINGNYAIELTDTPKIKIKSGEEELWGVVRFIENEPDKLQLTLGDMKPGAQSSNSPEANAFQITLTRRENDKTYLRNKARDLRISAASNFVSGELHLYPTAFEFLETATSMNKEAELRETATVLKSKGEQTKSKKLLESANNVLAEAELINAERVARRRRLQQTNDARSQAVGMAANIHALRLEDRNAEADVLQNALHTLLRSIDPKQQKAAELSQAIVDARVAGDHATADAMTQQLAAIERELNVRYQILRETAADSEKKMTTFQLKNVAAKEALEALSGFGFDKDGITFASDQRLNAIVIRGPVAVVDAVSELLVQLDRKSVTSNVNGFQNGVGEPVGVTEPAETIQSLRHSYENAEREAEKQAQIIRTLTRFEKPPKDPEILAAKMRLQKAVSLAFAARQKLHLAEIAKARHDLDRIEARLQRRRHISDAIIKRRIEELLTNETLRWDAN